METCLASINLELNFIQCSCSGHLILNHNRISLNKIRKCIEEYFSHGF